MSMLAPADVLTNQEIHMRKMIMMAVAGFVWRQIQKRVLKRTYTVRPTRRYF